MKSYMTKRDQKKIAKSMQCQLCLSELEPLFDYFLNIHHLFVDLYRLDSNMPYILFTSNVQLDFRSHPRQYPCLQAIVRQTRQD